MTVIKQYNFGGNQSGGQGGGNPFGVVGSLIMLVVGLILAYLLVKGIFTLLLWFSIPLFIGGIIIDPKGALSAGKSLIKLIKQNPLVPLFVLIIAAIFYQTVPFILMALTGGGLIAKSLIKKKVKTMFGGQMPGQEKREEDFTEYEEVKEEEDFLELPTVEKEVHGSGKSNNEYDNLFD